MKKRNRRAKKIFSVVLFSSWISFMAVAGFFVPSFLTQLSMFQIKEIVVEGNDKIPFEAIRAVIEDLSINLLKLNEEELKENLNRSFGNRVKEVFFSKDFSVDGIALKVRILERKPVAKVKVGKKFLLIDSEGKLFYPLNDDLSELTELRTYDLKVLEENFHKLRKGVLSISLPVKIIEVKRDRVLLHLKDKEVVLPPIEYISENVSSRLKLIYNFQKESIDLRYGRFILVRN